MQTPFPSLLRCRAFLLLEESRQAEETTHDVALHIGHAPTQPPTSAAVVVVTTAAATTAVATAKARARPTTTSAGRHPTTAGMALLLALLLRPRRPGQAWSTPGPCPSVPMPRELASSGHGQVVPPLLGGEEQCELLESLSKAFRITHLPDQLHAATSPFSTPSEQLHAKAIASSRSNNNSALSDSSSTLSVASSSLSNQQQQKHNHTEPADTSATQASSSSSF